MIGTDIECGHIKTLHARRVNKSCKMIALSHLNSSNIHDKLKDNFMLEKVR